MYRTLHFSPWRILAAIFTGALALVFVLLGHGAAELLAQQPAQEARPWLEKDSSDWSELDRLQIMTDSPWGQTIELNECAARGRIYSRAGSRRAASPSMGLPRQRDMRVYDGIDAQGRVRYRTILGTSDGTNMCPQLVNFVNEVSWESAQTVCRARQGGPDCDQPAGEVKIRVWSGASAFRNKTEAEILRKSYIEAKLAGKKVQPTRVQFVAHNEAYFYFPRQLPDGTPLITAGEQKVTFVCGCDWFKLKAEFNPSQMVTGAGADI